MSDIEDMLLRSGFRISSPDGRDQPRIKLARDAEALRLREAYTVYTTKYRLSPGMIVRQKPAVRIAAEPDWSNGLYVVFEVLDNPLPSEVSVEKMDIIIGYLDQDEDLMIKQACSARFEPVSEEDLVWRGKKTVSENPIDIS